MDSCTSAQSYPRSMMLLWVSVDSKRYAKLDHHVLEITKPFVKKSTVKCEVYRVVPSSSANKIIFAGVSWAAMVVSRKNKGQRFLPRQ